MEHTTEESARIRALTSPELLEHIFLQIAMEETQTTEKQIQTSFPPSLYTFLRIDKFTQAIIMGSTKLRRFMWIDQSREEPTRFCSLRSINRGIPIGLAPLIWSMSATNMQQETRLVIFSGVTCELSHTIVKSCSVPPTLPCPVMARPDAPWRSIHVLRVGNLIRTIRQKVKIVKRFSVREQSRLRHANFLGVYIEVFIVEDETRLGEVFDWLVSFRRRTWLDHQDILRELVKRGVERKFDGTIGRGLETEHGMRSGYVYGTWADE